MASVEQDVKRHFAREFRRNDWGLFKRMADHYLERAVFLRGRDVKIAADLRLLARNSQKRLFIGIGTELLLKALYLRHGLAINKPADPKAAGVPPFPFTFAQAAAITLLPDQTYMLGDLIDKVSRVPAIGQLGGLTRGLRVAKVFRNKEGHVVLPSHAFDPSNYRDVEAALVALYARAFGETLDVRFSIATGEKGRWTIR